MKTPLSWTYVLYESGDTVGFLMAMVALSPLFIFTSLATVVLVRRELHAVMCAAGLVANDVLSNVLKKTLSLLPALGSVAFRPAGCERTDGGLPSSHAQFAAFLVGYGSQCLQLRFWWILLALYLHLGLTMFGRVYLGYHTVLQVVVGAALGILNGTLYGRISSVHVVPFLEQLAVCRHLSLRDSLRSMRLAARERELTLASRERKAPHNDREMRCRNY
mmetsp:Transcript_2700/g.8183  ORF Transcript_2700/g.8183 Transcript_2700/m.8183 type:complete len:219 (+) Transcript_2700:147-803(+)|eukprot:CAMPEP_0198738158 /NCGR_PEP_ID=MMETSP1475-20131203/68230_1 /TAXON_ID= ORGANISM="Unidentified sp., Strain CCMP1999" /NCGR_SAMPLE_ID=MMETSP1475 /ASSEMBLY_ACC=CAM_ASM_001111 /LENGTH=218 /DNA_ID=CAMNT_0044502029 /DNA_START=258 /DNA_END=914 /DNA_ORIENTATION=-